MKSNNEREMLRNCTLLISGPLISRVDENQLIKSFTILSNLKDKYGLNIMISTYQNELTLALQIFQFEFILNNDPGQDFFYTGQSILASRTNKLSRNTTRMLSTTSLGLSLVKTEYVIKTRVEILPSKIEFAQALHQVLENYSETEIIVFLAEHYTGLKYSENKPLLLWIPDVFHIMRTNDGLKLWKGALDLWRTYKVDFVARSFHVGLANEQVLGLSLVHNFIKPISERGLKRYHRYTCSLRFIRAHLKFENYMFRSLYYDELFLGEGRFRWSDKRSPTIKLPLHQTKKQNYLTALNYLIRARFFQLRFILSKLINFSSKFNHDARNVLKR